MNLLVITDDSDVGEELSPHFDETDTRSLADVRIDSYDGEKVLVKGVDVENYDALYVDPRPETAIFSRAFLEAVRDKDVNVNIDAGSFFILAKRSYLYQVLDERNVSVPPTAVISTEKGTTSLSKQMDFPLVGKKFEGFTRRDLSLLENPEELESFVEHMEHETHYLVIQEFVDGDVYDCLYLDGETISVKLEGEGWRLRPERSSQSYHSVSSDLESLVEETADAIGTDICRVRLVNGYVTDAYLRPDLARFKQLSGKNVHERLAGMLGG